MDFKSMSCLTASLGQAGRVLGGIVPVMQSGLDWKSNLVLPQL